MCKLCCSINWNALSAIGTIAVAVLAIWGDWFKFYLTPKLVLKIEPHNLEGTTARGNGVNIYFHLKVVKKRPWTSAKNCRVLLREIFKPLPNGEYRVVPLIVDSAFIWSPSQHTPMFIDISSEQVFDFMILLTDENVIKPILNYTPQDFEGNISANQKIRYALEITADGYKAQTRQVFEIAWDGKIGSTPEQMRNHLTINEID